MPHKLFKEESFEETEIVAPMKDKAEKEKKAKKEPEQKKEKKVKKDKEEKKAKTEDVEEKKDNPAKKEKKVEKKGLDKKIEEDVVGIKPQEDAKNKRKRGAKEEGDKEEQPESAKDSAAAKKVKVEESTTGKAGAGVLPPAEWRKKHEMTVPSDTADPVQRFQDLQAPEYMKKALATLKFEAPTPIQAQSWPIGLAGKDMIGIAETGSGKTLAYLVPGIVQMKEKQALNPDSYGYPGIVVLAPTRELAIQIEGVVKTLGYHLGLNSVCCYGGAPKYHQRRAIDRGLDIVIATPGRLNDFLRAEQISLQFVVYAVLDEADRMLDMGFERQIATILAALPEKHQTMMFSATWPKEVRELAKKYQESPVKITIGSAELTTNKNIGHVVKILRKPGDRLAELNKFVTEVWTDKKSKGLFFVNTKKDCAEFAQHLWDMGVPVNAIHGDMDQRERENAMANFKTGKYPLLFATDVAARGLDIKGVEFVVNVDFPLQFESFVHRVGRTGRAGTKGMAYTFFHKSDADAHMLVQMIKDAGSEVDPELEEFAKKPNYSKDGRAFAVRAGTLANEDRFRGNGRWRGGWGRGRGGRGGGFRGGSRGRGGSGGSGRGRFAIPN